MTIWHQFISPILSLLIYSAFGAPWWLDRIIIFVLPWAFLMEVFAKLLMLSALKKGNGDVIPTEVSSWKKLNRQKLDRYTEELQSLGFVHLMDYTYTSSSFDGMVRLFSHPKEFCFAEIGQVGDLPMFCSISCCLEQRWHIGVTNTPKSSATSIIGFVFFRHPRNLRKQLEIQSAEVLMKAFLAFCQQIQTDLNLEVIQQTTPEFYFEQERQFELQRRDSVARKSIIWSLFEILYFSFNSPSEWLGEYAKIKRQRANS